MIKSPASDSAKPQKLLLFPGDPLINVLKPDYYTIVNPNTLASVYKDESDEDGEGETDPRDPPEVNDLAAPSLSDIKFVSATMVTDKNKNQYVEFVFNIKNSGGDTVIGVNGYGQ